MNGEEFARNINKDIDPTDYDIINQKTTPYYCGSRDDGNEIDNNKESYNGNIWPSLIPDLNNPLSHASMDSNQYNVSETQCKMKVMFVKFKYIIRASKKIKERICEGNSISNFLLPRVTSGLGQIRWTMAP